MITRKFSAIVLAALVAGTGIGTGADSAWADLKLCNYTTSRVGVAIATSDSMR